MLNKATPAGQKGDLCRLGLPFEWWRLGPGNGRATADEQPSGWSKESPRRDVSWSLGELTMTMTPIQVTLKIGVSPYV